MSSIDHFLQSIGAITVPEGTSANSAVPEMIKWIKDLLERTKKMDGHSPGFSNGIEMQLAKDAVQKAAESAAAHDYEKAYRATIFAALLIGHAAYSLEELKGFEAEIDAAFHEPAAV